ncbi:MAG: response regulator [bacterium]
MARKRVLLVDDDPVVREAVKEGIGDEFVVFVSEDGHEAMGQAVTHKVDVILLDIMMPGFDGLSTLLLLKNTAETRDIPVIMLTAVGKREKVLEAKREGAAAYILKPFTPDNVKKQIRKILGENSD